MSTMKSLIKLAAIVFFLIVGLFVIAHFSLEYGVDLALPTFFKSYWLLFVLLRLVIYAVVGFFLYKLRDKLDNTRRLVIACVIWVVVMEGINMMQLIRTGV
ncbi:hypothetical protein [Avibacterium sp. 21-599]|uniref:hypothetical protein n=1 Tax=Avibacterium sp. 21-599 TaxID=2911528 RepID=UPI0022453DA3|nr:hypothetical protein [Avibacterium sp. 21-599]MCW9718540.1 hypothetical protein [Avibacterium sp. 21-599]